ncbi:type III pantothenate kinase [Solimonas marina]|uniref:Type III pantothenate kinase n=1 Tax=Solimonas marina TaxID=2714601 RepID=A0A969W8R7_9GAMM|nr:type III pantothenate kinase [Solimonas marina]NKF22712.1 type III pantothenate kinase [Solimonas marina]
MKLLIDVGNTRIKWARSGSAGALVEHGALPHHGDPAQTVSQLPSGGVDAIWISNVTGAAHESALIEAMRGHCSLTPHIARSTGQWRGLINAYREPQRLGVDRWLAMIAVWHAQHGAAVIANAGTALTVDVITAQGQHRGGIIAAGIAAQQRAVLGATRFETRDLNGVHADTLGSDTESCVQLGAQLACAGAIDRVATLAETGASRWLTGGDAEYLHADLGADWQHRPHLVLEGLAALASPVP